MQKSPKKIGLALGGGGAKGLAHIGVIKALEDAAIKIDFIAGTSMGALVGGFYAATEDINFLENIFRGLKKHDVFRVSQIIRHKDGNLFRDKSIVELLEGNIGDVKIEDCKIPFKAVATDVKNGDEVILDKGSLVEAIRASTALPVIFKPVATHSKILMDGGFVNPVPADVVRDMGADYVIAVDVSSRWIDISHEDINSLNLYSIISSALSVIEYQLARHILERADLVLRPPVLRFKWLQLDSAGELIDLGFQELKYHLKEIRQKAGYPELPKTPLEKFLDFLFNFD